MIKATVVVKGVEQEIPIPHLQILSVDEFWDTETVDDKFGNPRSRPVYRGTLIGSHAHGGWVVKESKATIEKRIHAAANKHYNGECNCCQPMFFQDPNAARGKRGGSRA